MSIIRPVGKNAKLGCFEKEITEGNFINPTKEIPFKSCDLKKTMKTEEDSSLVGSVFTTDIVSMGYDIQGNIEMNAYPESLGEILYFTLGKDNIDNPIKSIVTIRYVGNAKRCRIKTNGGAFISEIFNGTDWIEDLNIDLTGKTTVELSEAINSNNNYISNVWGVDNASELTIPTAKVISNELDRKTELLIFRNVSTIAKNHNIYASNDVTDTIPSFSVIIDKGFGNNKCFGYAGCKVNTMGLNFATKTFVTSSMSVRAKKELSEQTYLATPFQITNPFTTNRTRIFINGYEFTDIKDLKIDISNNMYIDEAVGIDTYNAQDRQGGTIQISGTANLTIEDNNPKTTYILNQKYEKNEAIDLILLCETEIEIDSGIKSMFVIYIPKIKLSDGTVSVGGPERLSLSFQGQAVKSSLSLTHIETYINNKKTTAY